MRTDSNGSGVRKQSRRDFVRIVFLASQAAAWGHYPIRALADTKADAEQLSFLVVGDWGRGGEPRQKAVAKQMAATAKELKPQFIISVGDNFYDHGVASTEDEHWQKSFEKVYSASALQIPWYVVLGNHDYRGNCDAQIAYNRVNRRWNMPSRYYVHSLQRAGNPWIDFFFLDTTPMVKADPDDKEIQADLRAQDYRQQLTWLKKSLAESTAPWKVAVGHHPVYSGGAHGDTPMLVKKVLPLLKDHGVRVYLHGHDHDLQHLQTDGVDLFCAGAGSKVRPTNMTKRSKFAGSTSGFAAVSVGAVEMRTRLIDVDGEVLHTAAVPLTPV